MQDFDSLKQTKAQCLADITEALTTTHKHYDRLRRIKTNQGAVPAGHHRGTAHVREPTEQHRHATADVYRRRYLRQCQPRQPHGAAGHPQGNATDGLLRPRPRTGEAVAAGHRGTMARRATREGRSAVLHSARLAARPTDALPGVAHLRDIRLQGGRADGARIPRGRHAAAYRMGASVPTRANRAR